MKSMPLIALLLLTSPAVAAGPATGLRQTELVEGLPDFPPLLRKFESGWRATVSPEHTFVWIEKSASGESFWVLHRTSVGSSLSQMSFAQNGDHLEGTHKAGVESGMERLLRLRLDRTSRTLHYEWLTRESGVLARGDIIPDEELRSLDGSTFTMSDLRGKWVVLNWWATFCAPCIEEIPSLNRLMESRSKDDIVFLAVALDGSETLGRFLKKYPFQYRQSMADETWITVFGDEFPRHLVIAPDGTIVEDVVGGSADVGKVLAERIDRARRAARTGSP